MQTLALKESAVGNKRGSTALDCRAGRTEMKDKHRPWEKLGRAVPPKAIAAKPIIRILDLAGFQSLEDKRILTQPPKGPLTPEFENLVDELSNKTFVIARDDTKYELPYEYWDLDDEDPEKWAMSEAYHAHESKFVREDLSYDERAAHLKKLGRDFTNESGNLLQITDLFCRQAEAVSLGIAGRMPDTSSLGLDSWTARIERDARRFKQSTQKKSTAVDR